MKKNLYVYLITLIVIVSSCNTQGDLEEFETLSFSNELVAEFGGANATGVVEIEDNYIGETSIKFEGESLTKVFYLYRDKEKPTGLSLKNEAEILFFDQLLILNIKGEEDLYIYHINRELSNDILNRIKEETNRGIVSLDVIGISLYNLSKEEFAQFEIVSGQPFSKTIGTVLWPDYNSKILLSECSSGGSGATSCNESWQNGQSGGSCGVSCGEGYYACCNAVAGGCNCKPNDGLEEN